MCIHVLINYVCMCMCVYVCTGEPIVPGEKCVLEIHKQHNSLGLRIVGGVETQLVSKRVPLGFPHSLPQHPLPLFLPFPPSPPLSPFPPL